MLRHAIALVLLAALSASAWAQPPPVSPAPPVAPAPVYVPPPAPVHAPPLPPGVLFGPPLAPPGLAPGPPIVYFKSGSIPIGNDGFYPYDTGAFLLGGAAGLARYSGHFTMSLPDSGSYHGGVAAGARQAHRLHLFHRR